MQESKRESDEIFRQLDRMRRAWEHVNACAPFRQAKSVRRRRTCGAKQRRKNGERRKGFKQRGSSKRRSRQAGPVPRANLR